MYHSDSQVAFTVSEKDVDGIYAFLMKEIESVWDYECRLRFEGREREWHAGVPQFIAAFMQGRKCPPGAALDVRVYEMSGRLRNMSIEDILDLQFDGIPHGGTVQGDSIRTYIKKNIVGSVFDALEADNSWFSSLRKWNIDALREVVLKLNIRIFSKSEGMAGYDTLRAAILREAYARLYSVAFAD